MIPNWIEVGVNDEFIAEVVRHIKRNHMGIDKAAKKDQLINEMFPTLREGEYGNTERILRKAIEEANQGHGALIVSDTVHGYWWAASLSDGLEPAEKNMARARTILTNAKKLVDNLKETYGGQMGFGL